MARFVILEHDHPVRHWDLMLQTDAVLRTWRLAEPPTRTAGPIAAEALADHRLAYLDYEGPVSGSRGTVARWDSGSYAGGAASPDEWRLDLAGSRVQGRARLHRQNGLAWVFTWEPADSEESTQPSRPAARLFGKPCP